MHPFARVKVLTSQDYKQLRETARSRKLPAGEVKRAKIVLLSNQGYTAREIATKLDKTWSRLLIIRQVATVEHTVACEPQDGLQLCSTRLGGLL